MEKHQIHTYIHTFHQIFRWRHDLWEFPLNKAQELLKINITSLFLYAPELSSRTVEDCYEVEMFETHRSEQGARI